MSWHGSFWSKAILGAPSAVRCADSSYAPDLYTSPFSHFHEPRPLGHLPDGITHSDFERIALARASILSASPARPVCRSSAP